MALTAAVLAPLTVFTVRAQTASGGASIKGTVYDPTGARVPKAHLTAKNTDANYAVETDANATGAYAFANLAAGHYTIEATVPGFKRFEAGNLALVSGGTIQADVNLEVGGIRMWSLVTASGPAKAQAVKPAAAAQPIKVGGMVQASQLLQQTRPVYPADLQAQGVEGTVVMQAILSKEGLPLSLTLRNTTANPEFVAAAKAAVSQWRFQPTLLNGEPVEVVTDIQVDFKLNAQ